MFLTLIFSWFHLGMCSFDAVCSRRVHSFMALGLLISNVMLVSCTKMNDAERSRRRHEGLSKPPLAALQKVGGVGKELLAT